MTTRKRGRRTAAEVLAELAVDPDYQARKRAADRERDERFAKIRKEAEPLVAALGELGWKVQSVWDFVSEMGDYSNAYPVLVEHLKRPYHERTLDGIARALTVPDAFEVAWDTVYEQFIRHKTTNTTGVCFALGNALSMMMEESVLPQVFELLTDRGFGENRVRLVEVLAEYRDLDDVRRMLEQMTQDPDVAKEANRALTARRVRRRPGKPRPSKPSPC